MAYESEREQMKKLRLADLRARGVTDELMVAYTEDRINYIRLDGDRPSFDEFTKGRYRGEGVS